MKFTTSVFLGGAGATAAGSDPARLLVLQLGSYKKNLEKRKRSLCSLGGLRLSTVSVHVLFLAPFKAQM